MLSETIKKRKQQGQQPNGAPVVMVGDPGRFRSSFGIGHDVCSQVWELMTVYGTKPTKSLPKHLLWCLLFMKTYETEVFLSSLVGVAEKSFRKWVWAFIDAISQLYDRVVSTIFFLLFSTVFTATNF